VGVGAINDETTPLERLTAAAVIGAMLWIGANWILALTHTLTRPALVVVSLLFIGGAIVALWKYRPKPTVDVFTVAVLIPIAIWIVFVLWRGVLLPPDNHDALAYHLPKAAFMAQTHGFGYFVTGDPRVTVLPANYELLLADVLILTGTDHITEWIGTLFYVLFLLATAAATERWFGRGPQIAAVVLATAATPVLLLHSGADKNDLMTSFFAVTALMWGARWFVRGGTMPWLLTIFSLVLGGGTKPHVAAVLLGLAPFFIVRAIRNRPKWSELGLTAAIAAVAFAIGGGAVYVTNFAHARDRAAAIGQTPNFIGYGDWANFWRFPYMLLAEPFSREPLGVFVPWRQEWWFWPRYELFFSGYGPLFTILVCLIPYCVYRYRDRIDERRVFCIAATVAAFATMPLQFRPLGFFGGLPRFIAFIVPAVLAYSIVPIVAHARAGVARAIVIVLAIYCAYEMAQCGYRDRFSPLQYVLMAAKEGHTRWIWISPWRAANVIDRVAGVNDTVAVDVDFDTWIYPAIGEYHGRRVEIIPHDKDVVRIPLDARWVMVDRTWNLIWRDPRMTDMSKAFDVMFAGAPTAEDTRVIRVLLNDPQHWELVYYKPRLNQAIFKRRS